jgi:hypothetical protein
MRTITKFEIALGLVPITLVLTPLLTFGTGMLFVSALLMLVSSGLSPREALGFAGLILWLLAGLFGLIMVWIVTVESESTIEFSRGARAVRIAGLLGGAIAASLWLYDSVRTGVRWDPTSIAFWGLLFLGPTALGLRHGLRLFWNDAHPLSD